MRRVAWVFCLASLVPVLAVANLQADTGDKKPGTIAVFNLHGSVSELSQDESFSLSGSIGGTTLRDLVTRMKKAGDDSAVKAVVLLAEDASVGSAQREELRQAMALLRSKGKDIYVHADSMTLGDYVLFSGASRISVVPTGDLMITGLFGEQPFLRGLLDKLKVEPDFLTCGEYKSAGEIFMRKEPSPEAERMQNWLLDSMFESYVSLIAKGRNTDAGHVKSWIDGGPYTAEKALKAGLIDAVEHRQQFQAMLKTKFGRDVKFDRKYGKKSPPKMDFNSPLALFKIMGDLMGDGQKKKNTKSAIAIVHVDGAISTGSGKSSPFSATSGAYSSDIRKALDEAAQDDSVKAVVLRVDSPGGSAVASEIILDATKRVKARKPFVVSMGDVAGSGGYYVACASDVIFADESTITGSIGVVTGKLVTTKMWNELGINFKPYKRGANAGMLSSATPFSKEEREKMQAFMDEIYGVFKGHVVAIRGSKLKKPIDELAGGRVYTGKQALELGLVDKIGTLQDAIKHVADQGKITNYEVRVIPEPKPFLEQLLEELSGTKEEDPHRIDAKLGLAKGSLLQMALPHLQHLDPMRLKAVLQSLQQLQTLQEEGVVLAMPPFVIGK